MNFKQKFLAQAGNFKKELIEIPNIGTVEIRELSVNQRSAIYKSAIKVTGHGSEATTETDTGLLQAWSIICSAYDPDTGAPIFEKADLDTLLAMPSTIIDRLAKPALEFLGEDPEEEAKN